MYTDKFVENNVDKHINLAN